MWNLIHRDARVRYLTAPLVEPRKSSGDDETWTRRAWLLTADCPPQSEFLRSHRCQPGERVQFGRVSYKRWKGQRIVPAEQGELEPLFVDGSLRSDLGDGLTEIINLDLEPLIFGQGWGLKLLEPALHGLPPTEFVVCEPKPTLFTDVPESASLKAVMSFWIERCGLEPIDLVPGFLGGSCGDILRCVSGKQLSE